jgi:hypothetical protein
MDAVTSADMIRSPMASCRRQGALAAARRKRGGRAVTPRRGDDGPSGTSKLLTATDGPSGTSKLLTATDLYCTSIVKGLSHVLTFCFNNKAKRPRFYVY